MDMASPRNLKPSSVQGFDASNTSDKMQSSTLKRQPSPDWSKADLLRLLSYFEGELQARDVTIATLKAEKAKQLLYQAKYGRFGLGDPFVALQRDAEGRNDTGFDEAAIKSMYDNQLAQLENLIATQRKAQLKMREQLGNSEKRFHKVCTELEEEKQKHAQDTAQGDDVTYMLEKERERLKAEIDFEKSQNKKLEKDLKKTLANLEEERANAGRHKQVAIMLIKERKSLIERVIAENQLRDEMETALTDEKSKMLNIAEGLAQESKKSLKMEVAMEKQNNQFDSERESLRIRLQEEEKHSSSLRADVAKLSQQLEMLQQQGRSGAGSPSSIQIRSLSSTPHSTGPPVRSGATTSGVSSTLGSSQQSVSPNVNNSTPQAHSNPQLTATSNTPLARGPGPGLQQTPGGNKPLFVKTSPKVLDGGRIGSSSPEREVIYRADMSTPGGGVGRRTSGPSGVRIGPVGASAGADKLEVDTGTGTRVVSISPGSSTTVTAHGGGKISFHVAGGGSSGGSVNPHVRKTPGYGLSSSPAGRGVPPPIPPNKPNFVAPGGSKPSPPPKVSVVGSGVIVHGQYSNAPGKTPAQQQPLTVQIPVNVVSGPTTSAGSQSAPNSAVVNVRTQCVVVGSDPVEPPSTNVVVSHESPSLDFLGPEMASLQQLLATMTTGETSQSHPLITNSPTRSTSLSSSSSPLSHFSAQFASTLPHPTPAPLSNTTNAINGNSSDAGITTKNLIPTVVSNLADESQTLDTSRDSTTTEGGNSEKDAMIKISSSSKASSLSLSSSPAEPVPYHIYDEHTTDTPATYMIHHISSATTVSPASHVTLPSSEISSCPELTLPSQPSTVIVTQPQSSNSSSPSLKRRTVSSTRSRSKSPSKTTHHQHYYHHTRSFSSSSASSPGLQSLATTPNTSHIPLPTPATSTTAYISKSSPAEVKGSRVHSLAANGDLEDLHSLLAEQGKDVHHTLKDGTTPLHCATENNHEACVKLLLDLGAKASCLTDDRVTPLHIAAFRGHTGCLRALLGRGAAVNITTLRNQTPLHLAVKAGHLENCQLLLRHGANVLFTGQDNLTPIHYAVLNNQPEMLKVLLDRMKLGGSTRDSDVAHQLVAMVDKDNWSITHMAAHLSKQDCLVMLAENLPLDFDAKDNLGRPVKAVASATCKELLADIDRPSSPSVKVVVDMHYILENTTVSSVRIGTMEVRPGIGWRMMEDRLRAVLNGYLAQLDAGLKTRRITRLGFDVDKYDKDFTLGLTMTSIKQFEMGFYKWTPGMQTDTSPYLILRNNEQKRVTITVDDSDNMCELIAFDVLHPVASINNYLRLAEDLTTHMGNKDLEQYKSVIFYGPSGSGKSYLAHRLAQSIASQEKSNGRKPVIYQLSLHKDYTFLNFLTFLKQKNCIVPINRESDNLAPIILLDNLETVDISHLFGELLDPIEYRGIGHAFCLRGDQQGENGMHYLVDKLYIIGTMSKSRSLGVDLSILPRFRWVQFRLDTEPLRGLLARHFLRRIFNVYHGGLPVPDDLILRSVEWVVCVWQRLNDSLNKLGLPEVNIGPCLFFRCPVEKQDHKLILEWLKNLWNQQIAPRVREAVKRGTGSEAPSDGQQKVANTALYVLMQRSVILSCPLSGQEKESYLAAFSGSNELDIPLKSGDKVRATSVSSTGIATSRGGHTHQQQQKVRVADATQVHNRAERWKVEGSVAATSRPTSSSALSSFRIRGRNGRDDRRSEAELGVSNIKRRSLSESSVNKAAQLEQQQEQQQLLDNGQLPLSSQAKVAKLEVKSPKLVNITSFHSPSLSSQTNAESSQEAALTPRKSGRVSPLLSLVATKNPHIGQKKSRSSENISFSGLSSAQGKLRSPGPFSFSLATPTSNLSSFKFLENTGNVQTINLSEQMPDFSVFNKVPTPTDELPPSRNFVFLGKPEVRECKQSVESEEEVWSRRTDMFIPVERQERMEQRRDSSKHKNAQS